MGSAFGEKKRTWLNKFEHSKNPLFLLSKFLMPLTQLLKTNSIRILLNGENAF